MSAPRRFKLSSPKGGAVIDLQIGVGAGNPTEWIETSEGRIINGESSLTLLRPNGTAITMGANDTMEIEDMQLPVVIRHRKSAVSEMHQRLQDGSVSCEVRFADGGMCAYTVSPGGLLRFRSERMDCSITKRVEIRPRSHGGGSSTRRWVRPALLGCTLLLLLVVATYASRSLL